MNRFTLWLSLFIFVISTNFIGFQEQHKAEAQVVAQDICLARWIWNEDDLSQPFWEAPFVAQATGLLDLRSLLQMGKLGPTAEGWGLFAYDRAMGSTGMHCMGADLDAPITAAQADTIAVILGKRVGDFRSQNMRSLIKEIFTEEADPTGELFWKPALISRTKGFQIHLGGYGTIIQEDFSESHLSFQNTLAVRKVDYSRNARIPNTLTGSARDQWIQSFRTKQELKNTITLTETEAKLRWQGVLEGWTGYDMLQYLGKIDRSRLTEFVPIEYLNGNEGTHSVREPTTIKGDTFVEGVDTNLESHTPTGPNAGTSWVLVEGVAGDLVVRAIQDDLNRIAGRSARMTDALSSDDHYTQAVCTNQINGGGRYCGVTSRMSSSAVTYYSGEFERQSEVVQPYQIFKTVTGTRTSLGTLGATGDSANNNLLKLEVNVSNLDLYGVDATELKITLIDTSITGNLFAGLIGQHTGGSRIQWDNFEAADLALPPTPPPPTRRIITIN